MAHLLLICRCCPRQHGRSQELPHRQEHRVVVPEPVNSVSARLALRLFGYRVLLEVISDGGSKKEGARSRVSRSARAFRILCGACEWRASPAVSVCEMLSVLRINTSRSVCRATDRGLLRIECMELVWIVQCERSGCCRSHVWPYYPFQLGWRQRARCMALGSGEKREMATPASVSRPVPDVVGGQ